MGIGLMAAFCEMAWSQGIDCWGHDDNRFLKAAEYVAKYNLGHDVPFTEYTWQSGPSSTPPHVGWQTHTEISGTARSEERRVGKEGRAGGASADETGRRSKRTHG